MVLPTLRSEWKSRRGESKERLGWYLYDLADQAFGTIVVTLFGLIFLNFTASEHAFKSAATPSCNASVTCLTDRQAYIDGVAT